MQKRLPLAAHIYLWSMVGVSLALLGYWLWAWNGPFYPHPGIMAAVGLLGIVAQHFPVRVGAHHKVDASIAVYLPALLLLGAPMGMALVGATHLVGQATLGLRRNPTTGTRLRSPRSVIFNTCQFVLAAGLGALVYYSFMPHLAPAPLDRRENLWALPAAAATMYLVNTLAVAGMVRLQRGQSLAQAWLSGRRETATEVVALIILGLVAVNAWTSASWLLPAVALPVLAAYLALKRAARVVEQASLLRESEERYRTLVEMAPDVIFSIAADGRLVSLSPAFERSTGWAAQEWLGKPLVDVVHPDDAPRATEAFQRALQGVTPPPFLIRVLGKGNEYRVAEITSRPRMEEGSVTGVFGIARDISERRRMEDERVSLRASLARLQERERIAMDLHDGAIQWLYAVALGLGAQERAVSQQPADTRKAMRAARLQIDRVTQELRNYLFDLPLQNLGEHGLQDGLQALAEELRVNALIRPELELAVEPGAERRLDGETLKNVLQITREATSNVIRHAGASKVTIRLAQQGQHRVQLTIRDNGRGFDSVATGAAGGRVDVSAATSNSHGQGLRNMATRAEKMGGDLRVLSQPGQGTEVRLEVPLAEDASS